MRIELRHGLSRLSEHYYERRFGIQTGGELRHTNPEHREYTPLAYRHLFTIFRQISNSPTDVLLDYGCGKGRALIVAATCPFRAIIGVDISASLCNSARANVHQARGLTCRQIQIICADAATFDVPDTVTVIYCFNAFTGSALHSVLGQVRASLDRCPRLVLICYVNRADFATAIHGRAWVRTLQEWRLDSPRVGDGCYLCEP